MCDKVYEDVLQEQDASEAWFQWTTLAAHRLWLVQKWFNVDHKRQHRLNPRCAMEGFMISAWLNTFKAAHSLFHFRCDDTFSGCYFLAILDAEFCWWSVCRCFTGRIMTSSGCSVILESTSSACLTRTRPLGRWGFPGIACRTCFSITAVWRRTKSTSWKTGASGLEH